MAEKHHKGKVGIVGSGLIGMNWAMIFASAGYQTVIYDTQPSQVKAALSSIKDRITDYGKVGMLRGSLAADEQIDLISGCDNLEDTVTDAVYVQESVPERAELKARVMKEIEDYVNDDTILASSTSCIPPSKIAKDMKRRSQFLVAHPCNPPYLTPLTEVVQSEWTSPSLIQRAKGILEEVGQVSVCMKHELPGFVSNRIQYAIINECWRLVTEGVMSAEDIDKVMWAGIGMRYAFIGPLEVMHLNADGIENYLQKYGSMMEKVSATYGSNPSYTGEGSNEVVKQLNERIPLDRLQERRKLRDEGLQALAKFKMNQSRK